MGGEERGGRGRGGGRGRQASNGVGWGGVGRERVSEYTRLSASVLIFS